jgi:hypothetical protein
MDEWRYVKAAVKYGLAFGLLLWFFGIGYYFPYDFGIIGSTAFLGEIIVDRGRNEGQSL